MSFSARSLQTLCALGCLYSSVVFAQAGVDRAFTALPGLYRVPLAQPEEVPLAGAVSLGYAGTEAQPGEAGSHRRWFATGAVGVAPLPFLQFSARLDGRYDRHPRDSEGVNSGTVLSPTLAARWIQQVDKTASVGIEAGVWFPGSESLGTTLRAASPHVTLFGTWRVGQLDLTGVAGYRLDQSAAAKPDLIRARLGDRLALGLSDFDAAQLAIGAGYLLGPNHLFAELSADLLVGSRSPPLTADPIVVALGARRQFGESWTLELIASASPSRRPALGPSDPLVPVEPRFAFLVGTSFRLGIPPRDAARQEAPPRATPALPVPPASVELSVELDPEGTAQVEAVLVQGDRRQVMSQQSPSRFSISDVAAGSAELHVSAPGYADATQSVQVPASGVKQLRVKLSPSLQAQIRGLVRSPAGRGLPSAHILIEPLGTDTRTDGDGFFELNVAPGRYVVRIEATGYRPQRREVVVEREGVLILNADLLQE